jgi:hypothetical protein
MSRIIQQRILIALKTLTVISFLCVVIDNGKFELCMALVLALPFLINVPFGSGYDLAIALYSLQQILYSAFFITALLYLFITAVLARFSKKVTIFSVLAIAALWLLIALTASTSFAQPSSLVVVTHAIFTFLSFTTLVLIGLVAKNEKVPSP